MALTAGRLGEFLPILDRVSLDNNIFQQVDDFSGGVAVTVVAMDSLQLRFVAVQSAL